MGKRFYRTVFLVEVVSEDERAGDWNTGQLVHEMTDGNALGSMDCAAHHEIPPKLAAQLAIAKGADPEFLSIDEDGNEVDDG